MKGFNCVQHGYGRAVKLEACLCCLTKRTLITSCSGATDVTQLPEAHMRAPRSPPLNSRNTGSLSRGLPIMF